MEVGLGSNLGANDGRRFHKEGHGTYTQAALSIREVQKEIMNLLTDGT